MPIDPAMQVELAEAWLTPYLDAEGMSPSHPLRAAAFDAADKQIRASYAEHAGNAGYAPPYNSPVVMQAIAEDVVMILRGVAGMLTARSEGEDQ